MHPCGLLSPASVAVAADQRTGERFPAGRQPASVLRHAIDRTRTTCGLLKFELLMLALMMALIWLSDFAILASEKHHRMDAAKVSIQSLSRAYSESTARIISEIDMTLLNARRAYQQLGPAFDIDKWAYSDIAEDDLRVQITIIDADGNVVHSTLGRSNRNPINIADRPHFKAQLDPSHDDLYISDPVVGRGSGQTTIQFTRKLLDQNGNFSGILVLSMGQSQFEKFLRSASLDHNEILVENARGMTVASYPPGFDGQDIASFAMPDHASPARPDLDGQHVATLTRTDTGLLATMPLKHYPMSIVVLRRNDAIFASYGKTRLNILAAGGIASAMVLLVGTFWLRQRFRAVASSQALKATFAGVNHGIIMLDKQGGLLVANVSARKLINGKDETVTQDGRDFLRSLHEQAEAFPRTPRSLAEDGVIWDTAFEPDVELEVRTTTLEDGASVHSFIDITEKNLAQERIRHLANHDPLTGLPNRYFLEEQLAKRLADADAEPRGQNRQMAVLFVDLDGFKVINDTNGHLCGDNLLKHIALILKAAIEPDDIVARLGGDEFVIVRTITQGDEEASRLSGQLIERISTPVVINDRELRIAASVGIAVYPRDGAIHLDLFRKADIALYQAKADGRATWRFYEPHMETELQRRATLEASLRLALAQKSLEVHYQAQFHTETREIAGFEALARWNHGLMGWVAPADFVPLAEETGMIRQLGALVLEQALKDAVVWPGEFRVAVNVSAAQLTDRDFVGQVAAILAQTGFPPNRLELEITETVMLDSGDQVISTLENLRHLGIKLSLDDFGTGYSSLSNLLRFYFDKIKIDSSFVQRQEDKTSARAILEATLTLARNLNIEIVAEGVETEEQLEALKRQGCPLVQGFLLAKPLPHRGVVEMLAKHDTSHVTAA
jgi:diguanylate cyclase (GGDEF)-like protein